MHKQAADTFRHIPANEVYDYVDITEKFLSSPAFFEGGTAVLRMLEEASCDVLNLVLIAANRLIEKATVQDSVNGLGSELHYLQDLLKREYASSERNPNARKQILDLIDLMLSNELYGVDEIIKVHDR